MNYSQAAPCRHRGAPSDEMVSQVIRMLGTAIAEDRDYLAQHGLTPEEYVRALPAALESFRGSMAASNQLRRDFVLDIIGLLVETGAVESYQAPKYGEDTVYRLFLEGGKQVGVIQKGCPDGKHSSVAWGRPEWADELYLWWVCDSKAYDPGEHVWKGVNRIRGKVSVPGEDQLDGVIFYNQLCGTADRPCPKLNRAIQRNGRQMPPPCIYTFPKWEPGQNTLNWHGEAKRVFPAKLLGAFGISEAEVLNYTGYIGFRLSGASVATEVTSRYGTAKATTARG